MHNITPTPTPSPPDPPNPTSTAPATTPSQWSVASVLAGIPNPPPLTDTTTPIPLFHLLERLKTTRREGWRRFGIAHGESIADHMYRMAIISMIGAGSVSVAGSSPEQTPPSSSNDTTTAASAPLDTNKCIRLSIVHDMAEALVGDITPRDGVPKAEKARRERDTMVYFASLLQNPPPQQDRSESEGAGGLLDLWEEYEAGWTPEARFVKDVDKFELLLQMVEYERASAGSGATQTREQVPGCTCKCTCEAASAQPGLEDRPRLDLGEFSWVRQGVRSELVKGWCEDVMRERAALWNGERVTPSTS